MSDIIKTATAGGQVAPLTVNPWQVTSADDRSDLIFPRAKIFQGTATEFEAYPNGKPGMIINHITGAELPSTFIPFLKFKQYARFNARKSTDTGWDPNYEPGAIIWMTSDPNDPRVAETKFGENGEKPVAIEFMNFMALFEGEDFPIIIPFCKTSMKAGKKLFSMLAFTGGGFNRKYKLTTKKMQKDGNTYHVYDVSPAGIATAEETAKAAAAYTQFSTKTQDIKVVADEEVHFPE